MDEITTQRSIYKFEEENDDEEVDDQTHTRDLQTVFDSTKKQKQKKSKIKNKLERKVKFAEEDAQSITPYD